MEEKIYPIMEYDGEEEGKISPFVSMRCNGLRERLRELGVHKAVIMFDFNEERYPILNQCEIIYNFVMAGATTPLYLYKDEKMLIVRCPLGSAAAAMTMEEVISLGVDTFVATGSSGCINEKVNGEHLFLVESAIRDEGASYHYLPPSREIALQQDVIKVIETIFVKNNVGYTKGKIWTTDGFYRETPSRIARRLKEGASAVDMECATLASVAKFKKVRFGQFVYFSDLVHSDTWDWKDFIKDSSTTNENNIFNYVLELAIKACKAL